MWLLHFSKKEVKSKPKSLDLKKQPSTKLLKRCEIKMGGQGLLLLIHLKILVMMTSLQNTVIVGAQGLLMSMGSKVLIKMTNLHAVHCSFYLNVLRPGYLYQKF